MDQASNTCRSTSSRKCERGYLDDSGGIPARLTVANHDDLREATAVGGGGHDRGRTRRRESSTTRCVQSTPNATTIPPCSLVIWGRIESTDLRETRRRAGWTARDGFDHISGRSWRAHKRNKELLADANYAVADLTRRLGLANCFRQPSLNELISRQQQS